MVLFFKNKKLISFFMALVMIVSSVSIIHASASEGSAKNAVNVIDNGIYRIKNSATGKYIDTYDFIYDSEGVAYLDVATGQNGQDFLLERQEDGTYVFYALTEKELVPLGFLDSDTLNKVPEKEAFYKFDIFALTNGLYTIAINRGGVSEVLQASSERTIYWHNYITLGTYEQLDTQMWELVKVGPYSLSLPETSMRVQPYTIGDLTATVYPSYITDKIVWTSSDESVVMVDSDGSYCALRDGTATITATCSGVSASCEITVSSVIAYSWFSQHNVYNGGWNALSLKGVYFYSGGSYKPYIMDQYNSCRDWMDEGCLVCCIAMLLRNMDARLDGAYDIRSGKTGNLSADPYTVSLANAGSKGATSSNMTVYGNPVLVGSANIASSFKVDGNSFDVTTSYYVTKKAIKEALDRHPEGVIVGMKRWNSSHYLLFTECVNPGEKNPNNYQFIVCDPASYTGADGDHVLFEKSYSYVTLGYRFSNMISIEEWNLVK